ncbi:hypothetical protein [Nostoc sp.]
MGCDRVVLDVIVICDRLSVFTQLYIECDQGMGDEGRSQLTNN